MRWSVEAPGGMSTPVAGRPGRVDFARAVEREEEDERAGEGGQGRQKLEEIWADRCHRFTWGRWAGGPAAHPHERGWAGRKPWLVSSQAAAAARVRAAARSA